MSKVTTRLRASGFEITLKFPLPILYVTSYCVLLKYFFKPIFSCWLMLCYVIRVGTTGPCICIVKQRCIPYWKVSQSIYRCRRLFTYATAGNAFAILKILPISGNNHYSDCRFFKDILQLVGHWLLWLCHWKLKAPNPYSNSSSRIEGDERVCHRGCMLKFMNYCYLQWK